MRGGASFPTTAIGHDSGAVREFVQTAEGLGYDHIRVLDHVMGADPAYHPEVPEFYYTHESVIREPFTLMAYMAALMWMRLPRFTNGSTSSIGPITG